MGRPALTAPGEGATRIDRRELLRLGGTSLVAGAMGTLGCATRGSGLRRSEAEVLIVGSGFAGTYLGLHLIARGIRTTIVEAGDFLAADAPPEGASGLFPVVASGDTGLAIDDTRTIGVGGTSRRWKGVATRLLPEDFRAGSLYGGLADWPIDYDELAPYYCDAESALGVRGAEYSAGAEPPRDCPYPRSGAAPVLPPTSLDGTSLRFFPLSFAVRRGAGPLRLDDVELPRFVESRFARLLTRRAARRILVDEDGRASAIEVTTDGGRTEWIRARSIVVAAGAPESARLLLASRGTASPNGLGNAHGWVGRCFNAHPRLRASIGAPAGPEWPRGIFRSYSLADRLRRQGANAAHLDLHLGDDRVLVEVMAECAARVENRFELDDSSGEEPVARLRFSWSDIDRRTLDAVRDVPRRLAAAISPNAAITEPALGWFHPAGVCRMAADAADGVVNRDCRLFESPNVYVVGASVFPVAGSVNPTLTIVALALRLGDHLVERLRGPHAHE